MSPSDTGEGVGHKVYIFWYTHSGYAGRVRSHNHYLYFHTDCLNFVVYHESIKRELKSKPISECRCDERLKIFKVSLFPPTDLGC
jgi:hypothetical protein